MLSTPMGGDIRRDVWCRPLVRQHANAINQHFNCLQRNFLEKSSETIDSVVNFHKSKRQARNIMGLDKKRCIVNPDTTVSVSKKRIVNMRSKNDLKSTGFKFRNKWT